MAKTKPIGVRFDEEVMKEIGGSAQNVLTTLESFYRTTKLLAKHGPPKIKNFVAPPKSEVKATNLVEPEERVLIRKERPVPPEGLSGLGLRIWKDNHGL